MWRFHNVPERLPAVLGITACVLFLRPHLFSQESPGEWTIQCSPMEQFLHCSLDSLVESRLWFHNEISANALSLDSIVQIRYPGKSHGLLGAIAGAAVGAGIGYLTAPDPTEVHHETSWFFGLPYDETVEHQGEYVTLGAFAGAAIGYLIGSNLDPEQVYNLAEMKPIVKLGAVRSIVGKLHRPVSR